jgi:hypothetical protein
MSFKIESDKGRRIPGGKLERAFYNVNENTLRMIRDKWRDVRFCCFMIDTRRKNTIVIGQHDVKKYITVEVF